MKFQTLLITLTAILALVHTYLLWPEIKFKLQGDDGEWKKEINEIFTKSEHLLS